MPALPAFLCVIKHLFSYKKTTPATAEPALFGSSEEVSQPLAQHALTNHLQGVLVPNP